MTTNRFFWVRHGENRANLTRQFSHHNVDFPLNEKGLLQARQTAEYFAILSQKIHFHAIIASPMKRALMTGEAIANQLKMPVVTLENFREINVGVLEDIPPSPQNWSLYNDVLADWMNGKPETRFPSGEDFFHFSQRVEDGFHQLMEGNDNRNFILAAHAGLFQVYAKVLCRSADANWLRTASFPNCGISEVVVSADGDRLSGQIISWASSAHLHGEAAQQKHCYPSQDDFDSECF